jgi:hypothetical protein
MSSALTYSHIEKHGDTPARLARLPRIRVAQIVMDYLAHGWSPEEICRHYPHVTPAEAHAAMMYYYDHADEIDAEIRDELKAIENARSVASPSSFVLRMRAKGAL